MPKRSKKTVWCECTRCLCTYSNDANGTRRPGTFVTPGEARRHAQADLVKGAVQRGQVHQVLQERQENGALLAGLVPSRPREQSLHMGRRGLYAEGAAKRRHTVESGETALDGDDTPMDEDGSHRLLPAQLSQMQSRVARLRLELPTRLILEFSRKPSSLDESPASLTSSSAHNADYLAYKMYLEGNLAHLRVLGEQADPYVEGNRKGLMKEMCSALDFLETVLKHAWEREKVLEGLYSLGHVHTPVYENDRWFKLRNYNKPFVLAILLTVTILHTLSSVSFPNITMVLATFKVVLFGVFTMAPSSPTSSSTLAPTSSQLDILSQIPLDIRTVLKRLDLEPECTIYACCASCHTLYPPDVTSPVDPYPHACTSHPSFSVAECGTPLVKHRKSEHQLSDEWVPIKLFPYQRLAAWLGTLLSRPGVEELLSRAWDSGRRPDGSVSDIMGSREIREFLGPDNRTPFSVQSFGSIHLVFSLFVDWFNPLGNKASGKSHSVGAIYMACLNLPPHLRFKPENIYLAGIIPGPSEPSISQINHYLKPLVDDLLAFWDSGVFISRTASRATGRLVRAAVIPLVCDLPALRKVGGFASYSSKPYFCSFCHLNKDGINQIYNRETWGKRTYDEHLRHAITSRDAQNRTDRDEVFDKSGIRWSELLRLPYWDPTRYCLVDAMHNLFLGQLHHHCSEVFGIHVKDTPRVPGRGVRPHPPQEQEENLNKAAKAIHDGNKRVLTDIRKGYLVAIAVLNGVVPGGQSNALVKNDYVQKLLDWYKTTSPTILIPPAMEEETTDFLLLVEPGDLGQVTFLNDEVIRTIRRDIQDTFYPSWVQPPPHNYGSASHGKLKASQWHSLCSISLVITLVRLWGTKDSTANTSLNRRVLENFINLVCATDLGTRRTMSEARAVEFGKYMYEYLAGLRIIFDHKLVPNHHLSLHLAGCLAGFGPVQGWWSFPFERYNGMIARLNTNFKTYEMPQTFLRYFCIGSNLRWLISSISWPNISYYTDLVAAYTRVQGDVLRDLFAGDQENHPTQVPYDEAKEVPLDPDTYTSLLTAVNERCTVKFVSLLSMPWMSRWTHPVLSDRGQPLRKYEIRGRIFGTGTRSKRNSFVMCRLRGTEELYPAHIVAIYNHRRASGSTHSTEPFFVVKPFPSLDERHRALDPYRVFSGLNTALYYADTENVEAQVLLHDQIVCHFAAYFYVPPGIERDCVVVRSLYQD